MKLRTVDISESEREIRESLRDEQSESLIITKKGKPFAALVPLTGADMESVALALNPQFMAIIERSRKSLTDEGGISLEEMESRLAED
jgi:hypothetical protein